MAGRALLAGYPRYALRRSKSPATRLLFFQQFPRDDNKENMNDPHCCSFVKGIHQSFLSEITQNVLVGIYLVYLFCKSTCIDPEGVHYFQAIFFWRTSLITTHTVCGKMEIRTRCEIGSTFPHVMIIMKKSHQIYWPRWRKIIHGRLTSRRYFKDSVESIWISFSCLFIVLESLSENYNRVNKMSNVF